MLFNANHVVKPNTFSPLAIFSVDKFLFQVDYFSSLRFSYLYLNGNGRFPPTTRIIFGKMRFIDKLEDKIDLVLDCINGNGGFNLK